MAFAAETTYFDRGDGSILGSFTEKEYGKHFEFSTNNDDYKCTEYPHKVWVTTPWKMDSGYRYAKVLKTRVYVLASYGGKEYVEKWYHKKYTEYRPV
jgi:hypothetical protein